MTAHARERWEQRCSHLDMDAELEPQEVGAHAKGWNHRSVAVCLIGSGSYTSAQRHALVGLILAWMVRYGIGVANVIGHNEIPGVAKACPALNMLELRDQLEAAWSPPA